MVVYTSHDQPNLVYYCVSSIGLILLFLVFSLFTSSFNAEISQAPQQEIKYNSFVDLTCTMAVSPNRTFGPIRWVKVVNKSPIAIINNDEGVVIVSKPSKSDKESSGVLQLNVTEEWIGAEILCGVEYRVQPASFDSFHLVTRWSDPHRLNGMHNQ